MKTILIRLKKPAANGDNVVKFISQNASGNVVTQYFYADKKLKISMLFHMFSNSKIALQ